MPRSFLLLGTSTSDRGGDTARREAAAQASLAALTGVDVVNLQFVDDPPRPHVVERLRVLRRDAPGAAGVPGPRKPIVPEMFDALAAEAGRRGCARIGIVNGDIIVPQHAIDRLTDEGSPAIAVARTEIGGALPEAVLLHGVDMLVLDIAFWRRERRRFRDYILGDPVWDNVYTAIVVGHGGTLINREPLIRHERHAAAKGSPFAAYTHLLAARDASYFTRWCTYVARAEVLRARGGSAAAEAALQREVFLPPPGWRASVLDAARAARWRIRHKLAPPV